MHLINIWKCNIANFVFEQKAHLVTFTFSKVYRYRTMNYSKRATDICARKVRLNTLIVQDVIRVDKKLARCFFSLDSSRHGRDWALNDLIIHNHWTWKYHASQWPFTFRCDIFAIFVYCRHIVSKLSENRENRGLKNHFRKKFRKAGEGVYAWQLTRNIEIRKW